MKITIDIPDIESAAKALNNAVAVLGWASWTASIGCKLPDRLSKMSELEEEELKRRFLLVKSICEQVEAIEQLGYTPTTPESEAFVDDNIWYVDFDTGEIEKGTIHTIMYNNNRVFDFSVGFECGDYDCFDGSAFGHSMFLSKEEAKAALRRGEANM